MKPTLSTLKPELMQDMSDLLARRRQLLRMQTMEKNRTKTMHKSIASSIKPILTALKNQLAKIDAKLEKLFDDCDEYKAKSDIIQSMPGVGKVVVYSLLSNMPELGLYPTNRHLLWSVLHRLTKRVVRTKVNDEYAVDAIKLEP